MRPFRSLLAVALLVGLSGCGFALREEAIPEVLPTTTTSPSTRPDQPLSEDDPAVPPGELPGDVVPIPEAPTTTTTQPNPEYIGISEDALEVSDDASRACRMGALAVYYGTDVLTIALEPSGDPIASADPAAVREGLEKTIAALRDVAPLLAEEGATVPPPARLRPVFASFEEMMASESQGELLILRYRKWWIENEAVLTQLTAALAEHCADEAYAQRLDAWQ